MPKVHHVDHAQQRYATVPVIDPATGKQKIIATTRQTRKSGRQVTMRATAADKSQPLDPESCESCHKVIRPRSADHPGDPYKWLRVKTSTYGSRRRVRCRACPSWKPWELSSSLSAQLAQVSHQFGLAVDSAETEGDVQSALDDAAGQIEEIAEAKRESAQNIEDGFQHPTEQSEELSQQADDLENWAGEIRSASIPDVPEPEETDCEACDGTGLADEEAPADGDVKANPAENPCETCGGDGTYTPDDPTEDQMDEWRDEVRSELSVVDESPV